MNSFCTHWHDCLCGRCLLWYVPLKTEENKHFAVLLACCLACFLRFMPKHIMWHWSLPAAGTTKKRTNRQNLACVPGSSHYQLLAFPPWLNTIQHACRRAEPFPLLLYAYFVQLVLPY